MAMDGVDVGAWLVLGFEESDQERSQGQRDPSFDESASVEEAIPLCYTCLDEDRETVADGEYAGLMYCSMHLPTSR